MSSYQSIEEIRLRKAALQKEIEADSAKIDEKWHSLFKKPEALLKSATPSQRISGIIVPGPVCSTASCWFGSSTASSNGNLHSVVWYLEALRQSPVGLLV